MVGGFNRVSRVSRVIRVIRITRVRRVYRGPGKQSNGYGVTVTLL
jgi:hypothetical protein